ncbi:hypothetical protein Tco_0066418 [Tanacetum coccineum]
MEKPEGSTKFHQIIDFLIASHIHYALTENPTIYASFIKYFWTTTTASTNVNGEVELTTSIDGQAKTIIEASLRRHLKLEDNVCQKLYGSQLTMLYSKELASPKQMALALAIPEQTTTGKEISNPFMAGSLPKTTWPT